VNENDSNLFLLKKVGIVMGRDIPSSLEGKSLASLIRGKTIPEDYLFIEWNPQVPYITKETDYKGSLPVSLEEINQANWSGTRTVISPDGWKLCLHDKDNSQLFNLKNDPYETNNLFTDPVSHEQIKFLSDKIKEWQKNTKDKLTLEI
jgi:hypothetical protein